MPSSATTTSRTSRTKPLNGVTYFISGAGGSLRPRDIRASTITATGFDTDYSFMLWEIAGDEAYFQSISRTGASVDAGVIRLARDKDRH